MKGVLLQQAIQTSIQELVLETTIVFLARRSTRGWLLILSPRILRTVNSLDNSSSVILLNLKKSICSTNWNHYKINAFSERIMSRV